MTTMLTENGALSGVHVQDSPLNAKLWIDPEVQALAGISDEELGVIPPLKYLTATVARCHGPVLPLPNRSGNFHRKCSRCRMTKSRRA